MKCLVESQSKKELIRNRCTSVESTAKCRVKSNATIQNNSILEDGRDTSFLV